MACEPGMDDALGRERGREGPTGAVRLYRRPEGLAVRRVNERLALGGERRGT